jgi:RNA polymerase sigma-70 factor (ECF subfamily)
MSTESARKARFDRLASAYSADLYRFAVWLCGHEALAKDLVQETYLRAWKALDKLKDDGAAKAWMLTILRREYARTFERKVPKFADLETVTVPDSSELEPDERAEISLLRRNILRLAPKYREPLLMQVVMGCSCAEISRQLNISNNAVMTRLFRAREQLKATLHQDGVMSNVHELF